LTDPLTLRHLVDLNLPIVAPMLLSDGLYSNFWCGMTDEFYYQRTDEYKQILGYEKTGEFPVPMVHTAVLVKLRVAGSDYLTFDSNVLNQRQEQINEKLYDGPLDDIIIFAISAKYSGIAMHISNSLQYGYVTVPVDEDEDVFKDLQQLSNIKLLIINSLTSLNLKPDLEKFALYPPK
jgi:collagen beta-1,O-galactosyltransferase